MLIVSVATLEATAERRGVRLGLQDQARLRELFAAHADLVWRLLRRQGLAPEQADDGLQQVFIVALERLPRLQVGSERAFLCSTAMLVARSVVRRKEELPGELPEREGEGAGPAELLELKRRRALLERVLSQMEDDLRMVLVLQDIEGLSKREAAEVLGIPEGTVASRTRRARETFRSLLSTEVKAS